jgi:FK506-binding protein 1
MYINTKLILVLVTLPLIFGRRKPKELIEKFKLKVVKKGDGKTYPLPIAQIVLHAKYYSPPSMQIYDDTFARKIPLKVKLGRNRMMKCWEEVLPYVSLGERVFIICPWELAFGESGANPWVPGKTNAPFELEPIEIDEDPEWHYKFNRERTQEEL